MLPPASLRRRQPAAEGAVPPFVAAVCRRVKGVRTPTYGPPGADRLRGLERRAPLSGEGQTAGDGDCYGSSISWTNHSMFRSWSIRRQGGHRASLGFYGVCGEWGQNKGFVPPKTIRAVGWTRCVVADAAPVPHTGFASDTQ